MASPMTVAQPQVLPLNNGPLSGLLALPLAQKLRLGAGAAVLAVLLALALSYARQPDWRVLFSNLSDKDGGAVVAQLAQMNVPYKYSEGGNSIMVGADRVHEVRLRLATQGLPKGSISGFELMDSSRFGITQFQERLNFQRGLEGELTRSIQSLASVQGARVHLALPNQNGFLREQQKPSASVLVSLYPGRGLDRAQVAGIVHLVASSVPELAPGAVSVLDDSGTLLSDNGQGGAADGQQLQYIRQVEQSYNRRILDILEPVLGRNNVRAQVSAVVDFSQSESTSEQHRPNQGSEPGAVRSQQISETGAGGAGAAPLPGVPGAASNQPQAAASAPVNGPAAALQAAGGSAIGAGARRDSVINYEVDKTVKVVRNASGAVQRLSAAVVLNYRTQADAAGKVTQTPLPPEQVTQLTALVREALGYNKERGDTVEVINAPFTQEKVTAPEVPIWRQPEVLEWTRTLAWPLALAAVALTVLLGFVRPVVKAMRQPAPAARLEAVVGGSESLPQLLEAGSRPGLPLPAQSPTLADARTLALDKPVAVANIVQNWVHGEAAA